MSIEISGGDQSGSPMSSRAKKASTWRGRVQAQETADKIRVSGGSDHLPEEVDTEEALAEGYYQKAMAAIDLLLTQLSRTDKRVSRITAAQEELDNAWHGRKKQEYGRTSAPVKELKPWEPAPDPREALRESLMQRLAPQHYAMRPGQLDEELEAERQLPKRGPVIERFDLM